MEFRRIVTDMILEDFLIAGLLGLPIDDEGYTAHQVAMIENGIKVVSKYEPNHSNTLLSYWKSGIQIS
jgi:hypothetical protein